MKNLFSFFLVFVSFAASAQKATIKTDTVAPGYYIPLDTNVVSCKVWIAKNKSVSFERNQTGYLLTPALIDSISKLPEGGIVVYEEITVKGKNGLEKAPPVRYVVGKRNSRFALYNPDSIVLIKAEALAQLELDANFISFVVSFREGEKFVEVKASGNKMPASAAEKIKSLPAGSKVFIEQIMARNDQGNPVKIPGRVFRIVE